MIFNGYVIGECLLVVDCGLMVFYGYLFNV